MCFLKAVDWRLELLVVTATLYHVAASLVRCAAALQCPRVICHALLVSALSWEVLVGDFKKGTGVPVAFPPSVAQ